MKNIDAIAPVAMPGPAWPGQLFPHAQQGACGPHLLAQNDDTAGFITVPEVYTATQARYHAAVGGQSEPALRWRTS